MNTHNLKTIEDARRLLEYFNDFHDGFIKRINITSRDEFKEDKSQLCTGIFDIELEIAHYNYGAGIPPYNQKIKGEFQNVTDIHIDLRGITIDWAINNISIIERERISYSRTAEDCFAVRLTRHKLTERNEWKLEEAELFTFTDAIFMEE